jgi:hypothetical protein
MNNESNKNGVSFLLLFLKNPLFGLIALLIIILVAVINLMFIYGMDDGGMDEDTRNQYYLKCTDGEVDREKYYSMFEDAGYFTDMGSSFLRIGKENKVDPVILAALSFKESGRGLGSTVGYYNNPGLLYSPSNGLYIYNSMEEGIEAFANDLFRKYISKGLITIEQIGSVYAPLEYVYDKKGKLLYIENIEWVPTVTSLVTEFGGLTMNCKENLSIGSGQFFKPVPNANLNSNYGSRIDPFTGEITWHKGIDLSCRQGDSIYAALGGKVVVAVKSGEGGGYGHHVVISHGDKLTLYAHMSLVNISVGDSVDMAQSIGECGSTGNSTGPHLHFEVQLSLYGERIDPTPFF